MDSPDDPYDPDGDVFRYLDDSCPEPLPFTPPMLPPPSPDIRWPTSEEPTLALDDDFTWDLDIIGPMIIGLDNAEKHEGDPGASSSNPGPSGIKEPVFQWVPPGHLDCSGCNVLREVIHSNGLQKIKLAVHGVVGNFEHLTIDIENTANGVNPWMGKFFIDLSGQTFDWVKGFLAEYNIQITQDGSIVLQDSLAAFYNNLRVRMNNQAGSSSTSPPLPLPFDLNEELPSIGEGLPESSAPASDDSSPTMESKIGVSAQRERTANMTIEELAPYFHLPAARASEQLRICPTSLKSLCRRHKIARWPHRKISSIDNKISKLEKNLEVNTIRGNGRGAANVRREIERQKAMRARYYPPPPTR